MEENMCTHKLVNTSFIDRLYLLDFKFYIIVFDIAFLGIWRARSRSFSLQFKNFC